MILVFHRQTGVFLDKASANVLVEPSIRVERSSNTSNTVRVYDLKSLPKIWNLEIKQEWIVDQLIPKDALTIITGESGCGKSSVVLALTSAVAHGEPFLGRPTHQTSVLFVDRENGLYIYQERFRRFDIQETPLMNFWGMWDPDMEPQGPDYLGLIEYVKEVKPLVVFDSLVAFHPGSEQDSSETREYMDLFRVLIRHGATVIVIHHTGKGDTTKLYRGSSDIPASADCCWLLTMRKPLLKHLTLHHFKSREGLLEDVDLALEGTQFVPMDPKFISQDDPDWKAVEALIQDDPGINQSTIVELLPKMPLHRLRKILMAGELSKCWTVEKGPRNASFYSPVFHGGLKNSPSISLQTPVE